MYFVGCVKLHINYHQRIDCDFVVTNKLNKEKRGHK